MDDVPAMLWGGPDWDYRCGTPAHDGPCLTFARPLTARQAATRAAAAALNDVGVPAAAGQWSDADIERCLDLAVVLTDLADAAAKLREKRAGNSLWVTG